MIILAGPWGGPDSPHGVGSRFGAPRPRESPTGPAAVPAPAAHHRPAHRAEAAAGHPVRASLDGAAAGVVKKVS